MGSDPQSYLEDQNFLLVDGQKIRESDWRAAQARIGELEEKIKPTTGIFISGLVAVRNRQPYIEMDVNGRRAQLTMSQARQIAQDLTTTCARTEADAMIVKFFSSQNFPEAAAGALLVEFRDFRHKLDLDKAERPSDAG